MAAVLVFPFHGDMVSSGFFGQFVQLLVDFIPFLVDRIDTPPLVYIPLGYGIGRFLDGRFPCFRVDPGPLGPVGKLLGNVLGFFHPLVCFHIETSAPELVGDHARLAVYRIPIFFAVIGVRLKPVGFLEGHGFALPYLQLFFRVVFIVDPFPLLPGIQTGWHAASRDNVVVLDKGVAYRAVDSLVNLPVRVLGREEPFVDAGVEAEDGGLVVAESVETGGGFFSLADGLPAVGERVFPLVDLDGGTAAVMDNPTRDDIAFVVVDGKVVHDRIGLYPIFACYQHITTMKESALEKVAKRVESIEGMDFRDAVELRYVREQRGYRYLCARWKTNNRMIARLISLAGFSVRHGGEAVKTQWVDAEERRKAAGKLLAQINHELALAGLHVRQGVNKSNSEMMRRVSDKLKTNSSFFRKEVREKALKHSLESRARHPERMSALRLPASCNEAVLLEFLRGKGIRFEFRKRIGRYIVDFYLPGAALAIDCQGAGRFPLSYQRHAAIAAKGVQVVYCVNSFVKKSDFSDLYEHIAHRQVSGLLPSHRCEDTVIWGARGPRPFGADTDKFTCERSYMNGCYKLVLTASSDNHVADTDVLDVPPAAGKG